MSLTRLAIFVASMAVALTGCPASPPPPAKVNTPSARTPPPPSRTRPDLRDPDKAPELELVESWPLETSWDQADIRDATRVWPEMIGRARRTLEVAQFYFAHEPGKSLEPILKALLAAGARGVKVRVLVEKKFLDQSEPALKLLRGKPGLEIAVLDLSTLTGGILHAKYFIVDGQEAFVGSQNMDWRALSHIHEVGVRVRDAEVAATLGRLFEADWAWAARGEDTYQHLTHDRDTDRDGLPDARDPRPDKPTWAVRSAPGVQQLFLVASPPKLNPKGIPGAADHLVRLLDRAKESVVVQLLGYATRTFKKTNWTVIDDALRRAAARGVKVRLNISHWAKSYPKIQALQSLVRVPGVQIKLNTIPEHSSGFIPYARVDHAKYMVVDDKVGWVGTSNWSGDYFTASRNVEVIFRAPAQVKRLARVFETGWKGPYVEVLDPDKKYAQPRKK